MIPTNEMELIILFATQSEQAGFSWVSARGSTFPDAILRRNGIEYRVEFEFIASNFVKHEHDPTTCDLIICWVNDLESQVLPVLELSKEGWEDEEILLIPDNEKHVTYWMARALKAEAKLANTRQLDDQDDNTKADEILNVWDDGARSLAQISIDVWGCRGGNQYKIIKRVLRKYRGVQC